MESNLRPLTLGEILDRTAQLYRTNFLLFAGISAVYAGALLVLGLLQIGALELLRAQHMGQYAQLVSTAWVFVFLPVSFIFAGATMAANNRAVSWVHLGEPASIRGAYSSILPRLGRYLWLMTIVAFRIWAPFFLFAVIAGVVLAFIPGIFKGQPNPSDPQSMTLLGVFFLVFGLLMIPWIVYAILMALRYSLAVPASVVEDLKARMAIRRSIDLSKGARGRIFLLGLLIIAIQSGLALLAQLFFIVAAVKSHGVLPVWAQILQQIVGFFTNSFIGPMYAIGLTLFYYDQRIRKEGFDIEWMMQAAGLTPPPPSLPVGPIAALAAAEPNTALDEPRLALDAHFEPPQPAEPAASAAETPAANEPAPPATQDPERDAGAAHE